MAGTAAGAGRGKVFISHAREDNARCAALVKWLDAWGVDYWFEARTEESGQLAQNTQMALAESAVFLRVCTPAANRSYWMSLELGSFLSLQADEQRRGMPNRRLLASLVLDSGYQRQPFDHSGPIIDASAAPQAQWLADLRAALGLPLDAGAGKAPAGAQALVTPAGAVTMSRRRVIGTGIAGAAALAIAGTTGLLLLERQRGPTHLGASATATPDSGPPPKIKDPNLAWWKKTGAEIQCVPALLNGTLYFGSNDGYVYALDAAKGHSVWQKDASGSGAQFTFSPAVGTQLLFFTATSPNGINSVMLGLDPKDGSNPWTVTSEALGNPIAANGLVFSPYVNDYGVTAYRQDPNSDYPQDVWFADTTLLAPAGSDPSSHSQAVWAIALDNNVIYASSGGANSSAGNLYAFDASDADANRPPGPDAKANLLWAYKTGGPIYGRAAVTNGIVYAGSDDKYLHAIDAASGQRKWVFQAADAIETTTVVANGIVYFGSNDYSFYAVDAASGKQVWSLKAGAQVSSGVLGANAIYVASQDHYVYVADLASGSVLHKYQLAAAASIRPVLGNGFVYAADVDGYLYAFKTS